MTNYMMVFGKLAACGLVFIFIDPSLKFGFNYLFIYFKENGKK